ncbi:Ankyrin repeat-containing domain [Trinorchestia longiramus]|nr:Ankyrin repeat-containing domain [Trinorchestia longiramus]
MADAAEDFPLHESVFNGNIEKVTKLLETCDISKKDKHGNTALHLAVMLGNREMIELLVAQNAPVKSKNSEGWSTLAEAISYGDRDTISLLLQRLKQQSKEAMDERRPHLINALSKMDDFYMELKWDFQSWVPLVSRMLPSDVCRLHKKGASLRLDTTLVDFNNMRWERGDISFLFTGQTLSGAKPAHSLTVVDNMLRVYQRVRHEESDAELEDEVDIMMSSDIVSAQMSMKEITFARAQSGWIFRADKKEVVGKYSADFYSLNGLCIDSHKRREHLTPEDLLKNKQIVENLTRGGTSPPAGEAHHLLQVRHITSCRPRTGATTSVAASPTPNGGNLAAIPGGPCRTPSSTGTSPYHQAQHQNLPSHCRYGLMIAGPLDIYY